MMTVLFDSPVGPCGLPPVTRLRHHGPGGVSHGPLRKPGAGLGLIHPSVPPGLCHDLGVCVGVACGGGAAVVMTLSRLAFASPAALSWPHPLPLGQVVCLAGYSAARRIRSLWSSPSGRRNRVLGWRALGLSTPGALRPCLSLPSGLSLFASPGLPGGSRHFVSCAPGRLESLRC